MGLYVCIYVRMHANVHASGMNGLPDVHLHTMLVLKEGLHLKHPSQPPKCTKPRLYTCAYMTLCVYYFGSYRPIRKSPHVLLIHASLIPRLSPAQCRCLTFEHMEVTRKFAQAEGLETRLNTFSSMTIEERLAMLNSDQKNIFQNVKTYLLHQCHKTREC